MQLVRSAPLFEALLPQFDAQTLGLFLVDAIIQCLGVEHLNCNAVTLLCRFDAQPLVHHVLEQELRIAIKRVAEAAVSGRVGKDLITLLEFDIGSRSVERRCSNRSPVAVLGSTRSSPAPQRSSRSPLARNAAFATST
jgi:hypothetical protein